MQQGHLPQLGLLGKMQMSSASTDQHLRGILQSIWRLFCRPSAEGMQREKLFLQLQLYVDRIVSSLYSLRPGIGILFRYLAVHRRCRDGAGIVRACIMLKVVEHIPLPEAHLETIYPVFQGFSFLMPTTTMFLGDCP